MATVFDAVLTYQFIKKLTMPFKQMPAYEYNLIDDKGNFLKHRSEFRVDERNALGLFDVMVINLKKLIAKIPGGASRLGTVAATLLLLRAKPLREDTSFDDIEKYVEEEFYKIYESLTSISEDGAPVHGPARDVVSIWPYTKADEEIAMRGIKNQGAKVHTLAKKGKSEELDKINTVSPVAQWMK